MGLKESALFCCVLLFGIGRSETPFLIIAISMV